MATEKRLIDANKLLVDLCKETCSEFPDTGICKNCWEARVIENAPTVDAVEVVHGRWDKNWSGDNIVYCNQCYMPQDVPTPYCASCGSKMDGERNVDL